MFKAKSNCIKDSSPIEAILDRETYEKVLAERARRAEYYRIEKGARVTGSYPFSSRIICGKCGARYVHRLRGKEVYAWICGTYNRKGKAGCAGKLIQEQVLEQATAEAMGLPEFDGDAFRAEVKEIHVQDNTLVYTFFDGRTVTKTWENTDRRGRRKALCQK